MRCIEETGEADVYETERDIVNEFNRVVDDWVALESSEYEVVHQIHGWYMEALRAKVDAIRFARSTGDDVTPVDMGDERFVGNYVALAGSLECSVARRAALLLAEETREKLHQITPDYVAQADAEHAKEGMLAGDLTDLIEAFFLRSSKSGIDPTVDHFSRNKFEAGVFDIIFGPKSG